MRNPLPGTARAVPADTRSRVRSPAAIAFTADSTLTVASPSGSGSSRSPRVSPGEAKVRSPARSAASRTVGAQRSSVIAVIAGDVSGLSTGTACAAPSICLVRTCSRNRATRIPCGPNRAVPRRHRGRLPCCCTHPLARWATLSRPRGEALGGTSVVALMEVKLRVAVTCVFVGRTGMRLARAGVGQAPDRSAEQAVLQGMQHRAGAVFHAQFGQDAGDVVLDGAFCQEQGRGDLAVGVAAGEQA
jgi:hypothetical protein